jgi:predicted phosphodiesterase
MRRKVTDEQLLALWTQMPSPTEIGKTIGLHTRNVVTRLRKLGIPPLPMGAPERDPLLKAKSEFGRITQDIQNGVVLVGSDCHYHPGIVSAAHKAFVKLCRDLKPAMVVLNGDVLDGASISRHARIGFGYVPSMQEELRAAEERLGEIEAASRTKNLKWLVGNHDLRVNSFLAAHASQFEGVPGFRLQDKFPLWRMGWSCWINDDVVIKHRGRQGVHAVYQNTLHGGKTMVTGHCHRLQAAILSDYSDRPRWGVDTGTMADPYGPQFDDYMEDGFRNWCSGFAVLTFVNGRLMHPEFCIVMQGVAYFRGGAVC